MQTAEHDIGQPMTNRHTMRNRCGRAAGRDTAFTVTNANGAIAARISRHGAICRRDNAVIDSTVGHRRRAIDGTTLLIRAGGQVNLNLITLDGDGGIKAHRFTGYTIIIQEIFEAIGAIRHGANGGAHCGLALIQDAACGFNQCSGTIARGDTPDGSGADLKACQLGLQITQHEGGLAYILPNHGVDGFVEHAAFNQLQWRNAEPFLKDFRCCRSIGTRRHAAHIYVMAQRAHIGHALAIMENWLEDQYVVQVLCAAIGVIGGNNIILAPICCIHEAIQQYAQRRAHGIQMLRNACGLRDIIAISVENRRGIIQQFAHRGAAAGAPDGDIHLGRCRGQCIADDFDFDGAEAHGAIFLAIKAPPAASFACQSREIQWVAKASSMMAGPSIRSSAPSASRSQTVTSHHFWPS